MRKLWFFIRANIALLWKSSHRVVQKSLQALLIFISGMKPLIMANIDFWGKLSKRILQKFLKSVFDVTVFTVLVYIMARVHQKIDLHILNEDQALLQNFIEWYAVFYTLALTLIISQAWSKYNNINTAIDREADALALLVQTARMCKDSRTVSLSQGLVDVVIDYANSVRRLRHKDQRTEKKPFLQKLRGYFIKVKNKVRSKDQSKVEKVSPKAGENLFLKMKKLRDSVILIIESATIAECLKSELIRQYNEAYDARGDRFDLIEQKLSFHVWTIFIMFSLAWLWGFFWLEFKAEPFKSYILGCTIFSITFLFYLARDLDDPTSGFWMMNFEPFDHKLDWENEHDQTDRIQ